MKKIVRDLLEAYEEKKLSKFEKLITANYKMYLNPDEKDYKTVVKLLMQILKEDRYEYLKVVKEKDSNFEFFVMMSEMEEKFDEKFRILKESVGKSFSMFDYVIESDLRALILLTLVDEHDRFLRISDKYPRHINNKAGIMPYVAIRDTFEIIFRQYNLMLKLIKAKPIGNPLNRRKSEESKKNLKRYEELAKLEIVATEEFSHVGLKCSVLSDLLKMSFTQYRNYLAVRIRDLQYFKDWKVSLSSTEREKYRNLIESFLKQKR